MGMHTAINSIRAQLRGKDLAQSVMEEVGFEGVTFNLGGSNIADGWIAYGITSVSEETARKLQKYLHEAFGVSSNMVTDLHGVSGLSFILRQ